MDDTPADTPDAAAPPESAEAPPRKARKAPARPGKAATPGARKRAAPQRPAKASGKRVKEEALHLVAEGVSTLVSAWKKGKERAQAAGHRVAEGSRVLAPRVAEAGRKAGRTAADAASRVGHDAGDAASRMREGTAATASRVAHGAAAVTKRVGHGLAEAGHAVGDRTKRAARGVKHGTERALERAGLRKRTAASTARRFYEDHEEEIKSLVSTAIKVGVAVGKKRLEERRRSREAGEAPEGARAGAATKRALGNAAKTVLSDAGAELARLVREDPASLPIVRHLYAKGGESRDLALEALPELLVEDPKRVLDEVRHILSEVDLRDEADHLARVALAPALERNPQFLPVLEPWLAGSDKEPQRAALAAMLGALKEQPGRAGDFLTAASVVLSERDEDVRGALMRLVEEASRVDPRATVRFLEERLPAAKGAAARTLEALLPRLGGEARRLLAERLDRAERESRAGGRDGPGSA